jgi:hypothetical protein
VPDTGSLSPLNLPYLLLPLWYAPGAAKLLEMAVAIGFMYLFLRRVGLGKPASSVGGLIFAFSGFQVVWTNWPHTHIGALIPALFWAIERGIDKRSASGALPVTIVIAVMLLEGFPSVTGYAVVAGGLYAVARLASSRGEDRRIRVKTLLVLGVAGVLALGLVALQLLPFIHRLGLIDLGYRHQAAGEHLPLSALITLAIPNAFGSPIDSNYGGTLNYIEIQSFIGASALVLIAAAAAGARRLKLASGLYRYLWVGVLITGILIFAGGPLLGAFERFPLFGINFIGRLRAVFGFFLAALAAIGLEAATVPEVRARAGGRSRSRAVWVGAGLLAVLGLVSAWNIQAVSHSYLARHAVIPIAAAMLTVVALVWEVKVRASDRHPALWLVPIFVAAEALFFAVPFWPRIPIEQFYPSTPVHQYLLAHVGPDRLASAGTAMLPGTTTFYGLRALTAHTFYQPTWKDLILAVDPKAFPGSQTLPHLAASDSVATSPILDRLSVRYFITPPESRVLGDTTTVSTPASQVDLTPRSSLTAHIPNRDVRAVVIGLASLDLPASPSFLAADLIDSSGTILAHGERRIFSNQNSGGFAIPVVEVSGGHGAGAVIVRLSLRASGGSVTLGADAQGQPALSLVTAANDGLRLVFTDGALVYERLRALPRIRWASSSEVTTDPALRVEELRSHVPPATVILSQPGPPGSGAPGRVKVIEDSADALRVSISAEGAGYLVVADAMQDGWRGYIDGMPTPLRAADHAGVAIYVPAGEHEVALRYEPSGWRLGELISGLSLVLLVLIGVLGRASRRRQISHV